MTKRFTIPIRWRGGTLRRRCRATTWKGATPARLRTIVRRSMWRNGFTGRVCSRRAMAGRIISWSRCTRWWLRATDEFYGGANRRRVVGGVLQQITIAPAANMPVDTEAPLTFRGYRGKDAMEEIAGKIVVCFDSHGMGMPTAGERAANARAGDAAGVVAVDDPYFTMQPPRWPAAYARTVMLASSARGAGKPLLVMRLRSDLLTGLIEGSGKDAAAILAAGGRREALATFEIPAKCGCMCM